MACMSLHTTPVPRRTARRFHDNCELREQQARLISQLQRFQVHLHQKSKAMAQQAPAAGAPVSKAKQGARR
jgi:hypothetical protein